jgi:hypothetical protein
MFDDRFARQNRCGLPPEFPPASSYTAIDHHLSGPSRYALAQDDHRRSRPADTAQRSYLLLSLRAKVCHLTTRTSIRLLGPCFKTGRYKRFRPHPSCIGDHSNRWQPTQLAHQRCTSWPATRDQRPRKRARRSSVTATASSLA